MWHGSANLDVLRSAAVIFVVVSHLLIEGWGYGKGTYSTQTLGTLGVLIFFVHTCLVLMLSLERQAAREGQFPKALPFLVARAFRIYPLSVVVVATVSTVAWTSDQFHPGGWAILSNILLIQNLTGHASIPPVLWSLPFELQMYLFLPSLYMLVSLTGKQARYHIGALWTGMVLVILGFWKMGWDYGLILFFPCFLPGVLAFCLRDVRRELAPSVLFLFVGVMAVIYPWMVGHGIKATVFSWPICLVLGILIAYCREISVPGLKAVSEIIARYSFGLYLVHVPMINFAFHYLDWLPRFVSWLVFFAGTGGLACLAYHAIEKPCTDFGRGVADRLKTYRWQPKSNVS